MFLDSLWAGPMLTDYSKVPSGDGTSDDAWSLPRSSVLMNAVAVDVLMNAVAVNVLMNAPGSKRAVLMYAVSSSCADKCSCSSSRCTDECNTQ